MAAGASYQGKPDVGDSNLATTATTVTYGAVLNPTLEVEGVNLDTGKSADSHVYLDSMALAEVEFKTAGNNAEIGNPGVAQVAVMKSGGNTFHGDLQGDLEPPAFQGNNISSTLAAPPNNLKVTNHYEQTLVLRRIQCAICQPGASEFQRRARCERMLDLCRFAFGNHRYCTERVQLQGGLSAQTQHQADLLRDERHEIPPG
jgi:hypothetical protein